MTNCYSVYHIDLFKKREICDFRFFKFSTQTSLLKSSESDVSENNHVLAENIVLMYSKIF